MVVVAGPSGASNPLESLGRTDDGVVGYRVAVCVVQIVCPFVDFSWPGLDYSLPLAFVSDKCDAIGGQDAKYLILERLFFILGYNKIHEVVCVGEVFAVPFVDAYGAVDSLLNDIGACGGDILFVGIEAVDEILIAGSQGGRERPVRAA